jgi:hypothetical protein
MLKPTRHPVQYFELVGNRAIYKDGWMACTRPLRLPWMTSAEVDPDDFKWELYHVPQALGASALVCIEERHVSVVVRSAFAPDASELAGYPTSD